MSLENIAVALTIGINNQQNKNIFSLQNHPLTFSQRIRMNITATHINYYFICKRKLWLFANGINMEHTSDTVAEGKLIHETSYPQRAERYTEIELSFPYGNDTLFGKIDFYDADKKVIHEIKKSDKMEEAHEWQVKFYIWLLKLNGITDVRGTIEYPKLRETKTIELFMRDIEYLEISVKRIVEIVSDEQCPERIQKKFCKSCSYFDFCYVEEGGEE